MRATLRYVTLRIPHPHRLPTHPPTQNLHMSNPPAYMVTWYVHMYIHRDFNLAQQSQPIAPRSHRLTISHDRVHHPIRHDLILLFLVPRNASSRTDGVRNSRLQRRARAMLGSGNVASHADTRAVSPLSSRSSGNTYVRTYAPAYTSTCPPGIHPPTHIRSSITHPTQPIHHPREVPIAQVGSDPSEIYPSR